MADSKPNNLLKTLRLSKNNRGILGWRAHEANRLCKGEEFFVEIFAE